MPKPKREPCPNCGSADGKGEVSVSIGCPECNRGKYLPYGYLKGYKCILRALQTALAYVETCGGNYAREVENDLNEAISKITGGK